MNVTDAAGGKTH